MYSCNLSLGTILGCFCYSLIFVAATFLLPFSCWDIFCLQVAYNVFYDNELLSCQNFAFSPTDFSLFQLHTKLTADELKQFALLLKARHTNLPFSEFCDKVLTLFGPSRKHLMAGELFHSKLKFCTC